MNTDRKNTTFENKDDLEHINHSVLEPSTKMDNCSNSLVDIILSSDHMSRTSSTKSVLSSLLANDSESKVIHPMNELDTRLPSPHIHLDGVKSESTTRPPSPKAHIYGSSVPIVLDVDNDVTSFHSTDKPRPSFYDDDFIADDVLQVQEDELLKEEALVAHILGESDSLISNEVTELNNILSEIPYVKPTTLPEPPIHQLGSTPDISNQPVTKFQPQIITTDKTNVIKKKASSLKDEIIPMESISPIMRTKSVSERPPINDHHEHSRHHKINTLVGRWRHNLESKTCIIMVGLPARGKSYISKRLSRYIAWLGYSTQTFNVGNRRRNYAQQLVANENEIKSKPVRLPSKYPGLKLSISKDTSLASPLIVVSPDNTTSEEEKLHGLCLNCRLKVFISNNKESNGSQVLVNARTITGTPIEGITIPLESLSSTPITGMVNEESSRMSAINERDQIFRHSGVLSGTLTPEKQYSSGTESVNSSVDRFTYKVQHHLHPIRPDKIYQPYSNIISKPVHENPLESNGDISEISLPDTPVYATDETSTSCSIFCRSCGRDFSLEINSNINNLRNIKNERNETYENSMHYPQPQHATTPYSGINVPIPQPSSPLIPVPKDLTAHDANFFDPDNAQSSIIRDKLALSTLEELIEWLKDGGMVGVHDATNSTVERRRMLLDRLKKEPNIRTIFIESICTDQDVINMNVEMKLQGPDYINKDPDQSRKDFIQRMHNYEKSYETLGTHGEDADDFSYIQLINVGKRVITQNVRGYLPSQCVFYLMQLHLKPRIIWLTRHGESLYNVENRIGGDPPLTESGKKYAKALGRLLKMFYPPTDQKTVEGVIQTDYTGDPNVNYTKEEPRIKWPPRIDSIDLNKNMGSSTTSSHSSISGGILGKSDSDSDSNNISTDINNNHEGNKQSNDLLGDVEKYLAVPLMIWTSTLRRTRDTGSYAFGDNDNYQIKNMKALNEIYAGNFEDMTYDEVRERYPREFVKRKRDKLMYRYPGGGGESYLDVIERLRTIIIELERLQVGVCVITHQVVLRTLLAYFLGISLIDMPRIVVPLHTLYALRIRPHGADLVTYRYDEQLDTMVEDKGF